MIAIVKAVRTIFLMIAIWQMVGMLPSLPWLASLDVMLSTPGMRGASFILIFKVLITAISLAVYYGLKPLQSKLEARLAAKNPGKVPPPPLAKPVGSIKWRKFALVALVLLALGYGYRMDGPVAAGQSYDSECTHMLTAVQSRHAEYKNMTAEQIAIVLANDETAENSRGLKYTYINELQECIWNRVLETKKSTFYVAAKNIVTLPNGRLLVPVLDDSKESLILKENSSAQEYRSIVSLMITGCQSFDTRVTEESYKNYWFGGGEEVLRRGKTYTYDEFQMMELMPSNIDSVNLVLAKAACKMAKG